MSLNLQLLTQSAADLVDSSPAGYSLRMLLVLLTGVEDRMVRVDVSIVVGDEVRECRGVGRGG